MVDSNEKLELLRRSNHLYKTGNFKDALVSIGDRSDEFQGMSAYFMLRASILSALNEHNLAVRDYLEVVKIDPLDPMPYANIGDCLAKNLQFEEAEKYFQLALAVDENFFEAIVGLGVVAFQNLDYESCESHFRRALNLRPNNVTVMVNLGNCYSVQGKYTEALELLNKAIARDKTNALARTNRALIKLGRGQFESAWEDYEYRWDSGNFMANRFQELPRWQGTTGSHANVLVWAEQGLGDEIMFASIFDDLKELPEKFFVECDPRLFTLFQRSFPHLEFIPKGLVKNIAPIAYQIPIASLGLIFRKSKKTFPVDRKSFLKISETGLHQDTLKALKLLPKPWIGVSWESYALTKNFRGRKSISANDFSVLTRRLKGSVINLQFPNPHKHEGVTEQDIPENVITLPSLDLRRDIEGIATLLSELDRVITIGNTVAHLCGALGVQTTVILPSVPDWRWGHSDESSIWYNSLKIIRNKSNKNWDEALEKAGNTP